MSGDGGDARDGRQNGRSLLPLLGATALGVLQADGHGILLIGSLGEILFANERAASILGFGDADRLIHEGLPASAPGTARLKALLAEPASIHPTLERLRFFVGFRGVMRTAFCRGLRLADGSPALIVAFTEERTTETAGTGLPPAIAIEVATMPPAPAPTPAQPVKIDIPAPVAGQHPSWLDQPSHERRARRFLFSLDATGTVLSVSPPLAETVGTRSAAIEGRKLADVVRAHDEAAGQRVSAAIESGETFADVRLLWPVDGVAVGVPVNLAALPLIEAGAGLTGFSGFGQCRIEAAETIAAVPADVEPEAEELLSSPEDFEPVSAEAEIPAPVAGKPDPADADDERLVASRPSQEEDSKVVSLRTGQPTQALPGFQRQGLSMSERNAFREIAKALGARFDADDEVSEPVEPPGSPEPSPAAQPPVHTPMALVDSGASDLLDRLPMGLLVLRGDEALFANRTLLDLTGYPDFATFRAEDGARAIFRKGVRPRRETGTIDTIVLASRDGEMMPVDAHLQMIEWEGMPASLISLRRAVELEQGKALRSVALDLKRARADAVELRAILNTATDGVVTLDDKGVVLTMNGAAQALFGVSENELVGENFTRLLHRESHAEALDYLEGLRAPGLRSILNDGREVSGREKKGGRIPLFMTLGRISEDDPVRFCAVLRDMTAWKRAEAGLTEARQAAELANAKKSDFLAKISHEIRTPMNAIIGFADLMQEERLGPLGNEKYKEYLGDIRTSGQHVVSLVNDLLDLAKIEAGRMELNFAATDLNAIVAGAVGIIQPQATQSRVLVRTQLAQKLPPVVADERSIRQIVLNMLSNATRFTEAGGQVIVSSSLLPSGEVAIRIRDTGIGMTASEIEQALEPFRQVGRDRSKGGTGLGLPLTKALVEANRAQFGISSKPGEGTLVEITFPPTRVLAE